MLLKNDLLLPDVIDPRVYKEAKSLVKNGYEVFVVCRNSMENKPKIEDFEGIKVYRIPQKSIKIPFIKSILGPMYKKVKTIIEIKKLNPDIIHVHELNILQIGIISKFIIKKPVIYDAHEDYQKLMLEGIQKLNSEDSTIFRKNSTKAKYYYFYLTRVISEPLYLQFVDHVITVNTILLDKYKKYANTSIIYNCREQSTNIEYVDRSEFGLKETDFVIIFVGKSYKNLGLEMMLEAFNYLDETVKCIFVGGGLEFDKIKNKTNESPFKSQIIFTGVVSRDKVMSLIRMSSAGIVIFPPYHNNLIGSPNKFFEYMLGGIPVIASDFPIMRKIIHDNHCGIPINPESVEELVNAINFLKNNPEERKLMGENGRRAAIEKYNWECQETELLNIYKEILK